MALFVVISGIFSVFTEKESIYSLKKMIGCISEISWVEVCFINYRKVKIKWAGLLWPDDDDDGSLEFAKFSIRTRTYSMNTKKEDKHSVFYDS